MIALVPEKALWKPVESISDVIKKNALCITEKIQLNAGKLRALYVVMKAWSRLTQKGKSAHTAFITR